MHKLESLFKKAFSHFRNKKFGVDDYEYAITLGMLSSFFLFIEMLIIYVLSDVSEFTNKTYFLMYLLAWGLLVVIMTLVHTGALGYKSKKAKLMISIYPYFLITLSILTSFTYTSFASQAISLFVIMIVLSWVKIFGHKERALVIIYSFLCFNGIELIMHGFGSNTFEYLKISITSCIIAYFTSLIQFLIHRRQKINIAELDEFNKNIQIAIAALENTNDELKKSHTVTASMLKLTKEVLINEQIEAVMQLVLDEALNLIPHGQAGSILILKEGNKMDYVAAKGYLLENLKRIDLRYEDLFQAHFDDPYEPNIIRNLKVFDEVHIGQEKTKIIFEEAKKVAKSCLTCSFKYEDKFYGSINLDNFDSDNIYTEKDSYLLKQLAQELEIIISIHHLYEKAIRPTKYDALTQAYTRTYCMKLLKKLIEVNHKTHIGVCTIDINQLKTINDRFGHDVGDQYLAFFADAVRKSNSHESIFGRIGGDEFLLVFAGQDLEHCNLEIENIRQYLKKNKFKTNGFQAEITFSSGLAMYPDESKDIAELTKISDRKMYEDTSKSAVDNVSIQLRWIFSGTI